jgi:uncharacterized membrane protein YphA (DoxX/SURF4 family)
MRWLRHAFVQRALCVALGAVFVYASHDKIWKRLVAAPQGPSPAAGQAYETGPAAFARVVYRYQVVGPDANLPPLVANTVAVMLPWVELLAGLLLVAGVWRREAAAVCAVLLAAFVAAVGSTLVRGIDVQNCGCFSLGPEGRHAGLALIAGDLALLAAAAAIVRLSPPRAQASAAAARTARADAPLAAGSL